MRSRRDFSDPIYEDRGDDRRRLFARRPDAVDAALGVNPERRSLYFHHMKHA